MAQEQPPIRPTRLTGPIPQDQLAGEPFRLLGARIEGDRLLCEVRYHAGGHHRFDRIWWQGFMESVPVQIHLGLVHDHEGESTSELTTAILAIDLTPIKQAYQDAYRAGGEIDVRVAGFQRQPEIRMRYSVGTGQASTSSGASAAGCRFPVFKPHPQGQPLKTVDGDALTAWDPFVMHDPGGCVLLGKTDSASCYRMWYTEWLGHAQQLGIAYAESADGVIWTLLRDQHGREQHVIAPTKDGWDAKLETVTVLKHDGTYRAWFLAYPGFDEEGRVLTARGRRKVLGHATSPDGIRWTKHPEPVLVPDAEWEQPFFNVVVLKQQDGRLPPGEHKVWDGGLQEPTVVWDPIAEQFRLWYEANTMATLPGRKEKKWMQWIGTATSRDGIHWSKHPENPVFRPNPSDTWDAGPVGHTNVTRDPATGELNLFYVSGGYAVSIGHARSRDGVTWERNPQNPVVRSPLLGQRELLQEIRQAQNQGRLQDVRLPKWVVVYGGPCLLANPDGTVHVDADGRLRLYGFQHPHGRIYNGIGGEVQAVLFTGSCP